MGEIGMSPHPTFCRERGGGMPNLREDPVSGVPEGRCSPIMCPIPAEHLQGCRSVCSAHGEQRYYSINLSERGIEGQSHPNLSSKSTSVGLQKKDSKKQLHNLSKTRYPKTWPKEQLCRGGLKLSTSPLLQPANPTCELRNSILMERPPLQGQEVANIDIGKSDTGWYRISVIYFVWKGLVIDT
ncbi:hypothetical protein Q9966_008870 [Columba livia]|nr:hypothetical protein Q9966_008870 [Columba livia]